MHWQPADQLVDLFGAEEEDAKVRQWKNQGRGLATWGPGGPSICECQVKALAAWFRGALEINKIAEMKFMSFLGGLGKQ